MKLVVHTWTKSWTTVMAWICGRSVIRCGCPSLVIARLKQKMRLRNNPPALATPYSGMNFIGCLNANKRSSICVANVSITKGRGGSLHCDKPNTWGHLSRKLAQLTLYDLCIPDLRVRAGYHTQEKVPIGPQPGAHRFMKSVQMLTVELQCLHFHWH
jgi:hypothetical protein